MSRIGKQPIALPAGVKVATKEGEIEISGPKGALKTKVPEGISCKVDGKNLIVERSSDEQKTRALHGLTRALVANAVTGVSQGFKKELDIVGVGYKAAIEGNKILLNLGFSHQKEQPIPEGIEVKVEKATHLTITGYDRQVVGQVAAQIFRMRKPEPYKGKGVMYTGQKIIRKAGKAAK